MIEGARRTRPLALAALLVLGGCSPGPPQLADPSPGPPQLADFPTGTITIETGMDPVRVEVWIAEDPSSRVAGLRGVEEMGADRGMVFLHEEPTLSQFTMQDTLIPLSLAAWGPDRRIASIIDMDPCMEEPCPIYDPGTAWVGALEVNQGFFDRSGIDVGDRVTLER